MSQPHARFLPRLFLALAPAFLVALPAALAAQATADQLRQVDQIFQRWSSLEGPGCAVGVSRNGETILARSYGMANLEHGVASSPESIYEAGSVSKQFTAAAIVLLALDGRLALDDDIRRYVPEIPDYGHTISIRHLLNHTSGLRDWGSVASISGWGRGARTHSHDHVLDILSRQSALNYPPGDAYSYTNSGYNLLAIIVERVSGSSFADFSRERIFEPLGLGRTQWRDDYRRPVPGRATAYSPAGDGFRIDQPIEHVHGNGGLLTTVDDLLSWTESLAAGSLAGPEFVRLMHETGVLNNGRPISYAAGLQVGTYREVPVVSHTGSTAGYRAFLARYPDEALGVAMLCNVSAVSTGGTGAQIADVFLENAVGQGSASATAPESVELPEAELQAKAGLYRNLATGQPLRLVVEGGELRIAGGAVLRPLSSELFQVGSGERRFTFETAPGQERRRIHETTGEWAEASYEAVEAFAPALAELAGYVGDYDSFDAEVTLAVTLEEGELVLRRRPGSRFPLTPLYSDAFQSSLGLVRFYRDGSGRVVEFGLRQDRVHDMRFRRELR